jgi:hypothetical protein
MKGLLKHANMVVAFVESAVPCTALGIPSKRRKKKQPVFLAWSKDVHDNFSFSTVAMMSKDYVKNKLKFNEDSSNGLLR